MPKYSITCIRNVQQDASIVVEAEDEAAAFKIAAQAYTDGVPRGYYFEFENEEVGSLDFYLAPEGVHGYWPDTHRASLPEAEEGKFEACTK